MELDSDKLLEHAIRDGLRDAVKSKFTGYNKPLDTLIETAISTHAQKFRAMLEDAIGSCVSDAAFRDEIKNAVHHNLAKTLIQRFGGEIQKQVNVLKSDPTTRARITLAIEEIVKTQPH
jgi:hypothetical protein